MIQTILAAAFFFATVVTPTIPPGTVLPVMINTSLNAKNAKPGQKFEGKVMQEVAVTGAWTIKRGSKVTGHVVRAGKAAQGTMLVLKFDELDDEGHAVKLNVSLRAVASMMSVSQAQMPINSSSDFIAQTDWVTRQVGGDVVNRGRGKVGAPGGSIVGQWTGNGVYGKLTAPDSGTCPPDASDQVQALWVFSTSACGAYDLPGVTITQSGSAAPAGEVVLDLEKNSKIGGGSGWLLVVNGSPATRKKD